MTMPASNNRGWGFFGTMGGRAETAWPLAVAAVAEATKLGQEAAAIFLDSTAGRHFADEVCDRADRGAELEDAIDQVAARWMAMPVSRRHRTQQGIPAGVSYLEAMVVEAEMTV